jgi:hypothetical protein
VGRVYLADGGNVELALCEEEEVDGDLLVHTGLGELGVKRTLRTEERALIFRARLDLVPRLKRTNTTDRKRRSEQKDLASCCAHRVRLAHKQQVVTRMQKVRTGLFKEVVGRLQGSAESRLLSGRGEESDEAREQRIEGRLGFRVTNGKSLDVARDEGLHGRDEEFGLHTRLK